MKRLSRKSGGNPKHLKFIRELICINCASNVNVEAHHLLNVPEEELTKLDDLPFGKTRGRGVGAKSEDKFTIPLCHRCHSELHKNGTDSFLAFLDPLNISKLLYQISGDHQRAEYWLREFMKNRKLDIKAYYECLE